MNKSLSDFAANVKDKKVAVLGIAVSNTPLIEFLSKYGAKVTAFDRSEAGALAERLERLKPYNIEYRLGPGYLSALKGFEVIFRTPIIRPDIPEIMDERGRGAVITSEMELFLNLCPATVFGVTGSDGKTTTTTLIYEILKQNGYSCRLGGNIGKPLLPDIESISPADMVVAELSSFQLFEMKKSADVAVVTNLSPNHLNVHKSYGEYINAKKNIFLHQHTDGLTVLNFDDGQTRTLSAEVPGRLAFFSASEDGAAALLNYAAENQFAYGKFSAAAYICGGKIMYREFAGDNADIASESKTVEIINVSDINIPGRHNLENVLAAVCAVGGYVSRGAAETAIGGFGGVEHRIEYVRTLDGVKYYNDSAASSPTRTAACLKAFDKQVILIAGGSDKNLDYAPLGEYLAKRVKLLILCGQTSAAIKLSLSDYCEKHAIQCPTRIIECDNYDDAVTSARNYAKANDAVILSPASASFDRFRNFEERGRVFKKLVNNL